MDDRMDDRPSYAPGCFGEAIGYTGDGVCALCPYAEKCEPIHARKLEALREFLGIKVKKPTRRAGSLPVKVQKIFEELGKSTEEVRSALFANVNPYSVRAGFVGVACELLIQHRSVDRRTLSKVLEVKRQWAPETAEVYARYAFQILDYCGAVSIEGSKMKLNAG